MNACMNRATESVGCLQDLQVQVLLPRNHPLQVAFSAGWLVISPSLYLLWNYPSRELNSHPHCLIMLNLEKPRSQLFQMDWKLPLKHHRFVCKYHFYFIFYCSVLIEIFIEYSYCCSCCFFILLRKLLCNYVVCQNPAASIGLYVNCGSVYESPASMGVTHLLERMAFKSTRNRSHLRIVREVEAIGGNVLASASREQMGYIYDALKTYVPEMVELLIDCVRNPVFLDWEVNEQVNFIIFLSMHCNFNCNFGVEKFIQMIFYLLQLQKVKAEISEASNNPQGLLVEAIHSAGFSGPLANPLMAPESAISRLNSTILEEFVAVSFKRVYAYLNFVLVMIRCSNNLMIVSLCRSSLISVDVLFEKFRKILLLVG